MLLEKKMVTKGIDISLYRFILIGVPGSKSKLLFNQINIYLDE